MEYGYTFKVIKGYTFEQANIFQEYVSELYKMKASASKSDPMYLIAKLLLNSLYGRFGMSNDFDTNLIISDLLLDQMFEEYCVSDVIPFNNGKSLISFTDDTELEINQLDNFSKNNISIGIAAAITAYARIHMSQFKNSPDFNLFYSDTDSIVIDKPLPQNKVGKEIGLMKLENQLKEGTFIAPKVYGGVLTDGTEFTKIKGFKDNLSYLEMKTLLNENTKSLSLNQDK